VSASRKGLLLGVLALACLSSAATAQRQSQSFAQGAGLLLGPQLGIGTSDFDFFIGAQFAYPIVNRVDFYPSFQYYFPGNNVHAWTLEASARYWPKLNIRNSGLYAGGGLNLTHSSVSVNTPVGNFSGSSTDAGLSLFGGWQFKTSNLLPFGQIRIVLGNADRVELGGGVNFRL
jgi:hypothetical protein